MNETSSHQITPIQCPKQKLVVIVAYMLMLVTFFTGISAVIAVIVAYVQRKDAKGSVYESHYAHIIKTFWVTLGLTTLGAFTLVYLIGYFILLAAMVYYVLKVTKGLLRIHYDLEV